jgi:hypothetical protein
MRCLSISAVIVFAFSVFSFAGDNLKLNPHLDYTSDSLDGPLITGDHMEAGFVSGTPAYVIIYGEACYNSKRQARRTVSLYGKYKGRVQFVVVDNDLYLSSAQQELRKKYFRGRIPHVVVLDSSGKALYNSPGEVDEAAISGLLDKALQ